MKQGERFVVGVVGVHFAGPKRLLFELSDNAVRIALECKVLLVNDEAC